MTWYNVTHSCGHTERHDITGGNSKDRQRRAAWHAEHPCSDCEAAARAAANAEAAARNAAAGLPELTGTEKQIAWAETIRAGKLEYARQARAGELTGLQLQMFWGDIDPQDPGVDLCMEALVRHVSASWWIEHRDRKVADLLEDEAREILRNPPPAVEPPGAREARVAAQTEATLRPAAPVTTTVCEIAAKHTGQIVEIVITFPEKRDDFRSVAKAAGYHWDGTAWVRTIGPRQAPLADRLAEIGHRLLSAGFAVSLWEADLRAKALSADFAPEVVRWVRLATQGEHAGKLLLYWPREDDLFDHARRLPGAKWISGTPRAQGYMTVPVAAYAAVEDFAEAHGFTISDGARDAMDDARKAFEEAALAIPAKAKPTPAAPAPRQVTGEIDPDLVDDTAVGDLPA